MFSVAATKIEVFLKLLNQRSPKGRSALLQLEGDPNFYFYLDGLDRRNELTLINLQATVERMVMTFMVFLVSYFHDALVIYLC